MGIQYFEKERLFKLDTPGSSYSIGIIGEENFVAHIYYGRKIKSHQLTYLMGLGEPASVPDENSFDRVTFMGSYPKEYPSHGLGDYKEDAIGIRTKSGHTALKLCYKEHKIYKGKPKLLNLPATFGTKEDCSTLELICEDKLLKIKVILMYNTFENIDVITRSVKIINESETKLYLTKVMSASLDMDNKNFDIITLHGDWARECRINRYPLTMGTHNVNSVCGKTGQQSQPFMAMAAHTTDQNQGEVYAMHLVYSGNFLTQTALEPSGALRFVIGIHPQDFCWKLEENQFFQSPEAVLVYSTKGIGGMTRSLHDLYRKHLIRGAYSNKKRPILINNWEATYFDFNTEKLLAIAREASKLGIEMLVMDDGWFGKRNDDSSSLGDWFVNEDKLPGGLSFLVSEVNKLGMKFGIWMEPEMVSPNSDLYRAHPDWAIAIPGRKAGLRRNQYVLDLSRQEIVDAIYEMISTVLHSANIEYIKWDMNRSLCDLGTLGLPPDRQGELMHRYVLGVYQLQERMTAQFPYLLLENCSSGGGRFDPGMLYYGPQIWTSDDSDAIERLAIQEGTAMLYPLSALGAHISDCPNHITGRSTSFHTRGMVALAGTFGYELDVTKIPKEDKELIPQQINEYHLYNDLVRDGDYYRIASYTDNHTYDCYMVVSKDKKEALVTFIHVVLHPGELIHTICFKGLNPDAEYEIDGENRTYTGEELMYGGYQFNTPWASGDFTGHLIHLSLKNSNI
ncbi:alpha-galactosidase [Lachnotalea glycerini]|uniref:Alpha-galactosidase n=1 Tax=Lachnotalea glycerini TaxID=1763509 RepID=A0A318ETM4_9FIRM|nr:alpha-galactosidase [Lachnotalea glycerini]PXV95860.1 alpha-galactosidase [Lachnotalea glycerini]